MKQFVALARVSSREQEREGYSLDVQEDALRRYATQAGGEVVKLFRIAETASKTDERKTFRELIAYAKKNAPFLEALLFYKVDRAARNLFDYVELERLESEYDLPFISVSQPTENTPAGRMMRRTLANMASFYTEQQSVDVREGHARRVREGWFVGAGPYGYLNVRKNGRGVIEVDPVTAGNVKRIFHLYAHENVTLDGLVAKINSEGRVFRPSQPEFPRSSVANILKDRAYIGEVEYRGEWHPGKHEPLVDRATWNRVQTLLGGHIYQSHSLVYAGNLIECAHCGHPVTGERVRKKTTSDDRFYIYYRCALYNKPGHPRVRVREADLEAQVMSVFEKMRVEDEGVRDWFRLVLASQTRDAQAESMAQRSELLRQETLLIRQQDRLLNMRLSEDIDQEIFGRKHTEIRDRLASIKLKLEALNRGHDENAELASKVFELSQTLKEQWLTADFAAKRRILEIVFLNCRLDGATLCPTMRKPFDVLAEGLLLKKDRAGGI
ncbi:recombinase family protein [Zavarzinella formosa]|uniref:recombinase family protein n=1 Tax=Zavarzinella formosa TaxID=360055 RepID=UPI0002FB5214|nr:recombinase family protein [Zavarzinella formosa]